jgi:hypothetical protein
MEKELRNKPHIANQYNPNRQVTGRGQNLFPSNNYVRHPAQTSLSFPPPTNAWSRPLSFTTSQPTPPPHPSQFNPVPLTTHPTGIAQNTFIPQTGNPPPSQATAGANHTQPPDPPMSHANSPNNATPFPPSHATIGNAQTHRLTQDLIRCIRIFNPNFSFQLLIQLLSNMLHQFTSHPYPSALPIIFNSFLTALLGLPYHG